MTSPTPHVSSTFFANRRSASMEFHIAKEIREEFAFDKELFSLSGNLVLANFKAVRELTQKLNTKTNPLTHPEKMIRAGDLNAMGLIDEILHFVTALYREKHAPQLFDEALLYLEKKHGKENVDKLILDFTSEFPPKDVYTKKLKPAAWLLQSSGAETHRALALEELMLLKLANLNPAFKPFYYLFDDSRLAKQSKYTALMKDLELFFKKKPLFGPMDQTIWDMLRSPALAEPHSLTGQLDYIRKYWSTLLENFLIRLLTSLDIIKEENKPSFFGPGPSKTYEYGDIQHEYENFTPDKDWMPKTVLIAKSSLVWLDQLSKKYGRPIDRLDLIPDEELDELARRGFTGLWLIGLWERSNASREIKQRCGNPEAAASAYSLHDYDIAQDLGGWAALENLKSRCWWRGIRLGSDMVPNHTGIDSRWVMEQPQRFLQLPYPPFPTYSFNGPNLSHRDGIGIYLEDHYYDKTDAAVVFKRVDFNTGQTRYIYHGNDGTAMPWNDTAQIDFLNPEAREAVIATIVGVCKQFPIVRFDAAMTLAKKHIQRLWFPEPGSGGDIASRSEHGLPRDRFNELMPNEFWREVVDRCAVQAPDTLLLAEAFWMMEGYFVRTLGMHRVYNSAFMNMLKMEENAKYRATIKNTIEFDPEILNRFVNFMNNPDEDTAVAQFGSDNKYFGVCTLMVTMPGLPMFGHGQIEGYEEKYGMEYRRAYHDEVPNPYIVERHEKEIFPLMKRRYLFSGSDNFRLYDLYNHEGHIQENVFAYSNRYQGEKALVFYNNSFSQTSGWIRNSSPSLIKHTDGGKTLIQETLSSSLGLEAEKGGFAIFQEARSSLWFIREKEQLSRDGIYVALNGYQAQVFLNWQSQEENEYGHWGQLCAMLDGRGVENLHHAFQDLMLKDLHSAFAELFGQSYYELVFAPAQKGGPKKEDCAILYPAFVKLMLTAHDFIEGAKGKWQSFTPAIQNAGIPFKESWKHFVAGIQMAQYLTSKIDSEKLRAQTLLTAYWPLFIILHDIAAGPQARRDTAVLFKHWHLDRKLAEFLADKTDQPEALPRLISLVLAWILYAKTPSTKRKACILEYVSSEEGKGQIGLNSFDDVLWFNGERMEEATELLLSLYQFTELSEQKAASPVTQKPIAKSDKPEEARPALRKTPIILDMLKAPKVELEIDTEALEKRIKKAATARKKIDKAIDNANYHFEDFINFLFPVKAKKQPKNPS